LTWPDALARRAVEVVADKWIIDVLRQLSVGPKRYTELQAAIQDVSGSVLTQTLRRMERNGLVARRAEATIPPTVEYSLTSLGETLREPLVSMGRWAERHLEEVEAARRRHKSGGHG
jgi:DNA-binding HxlR family transcriptional regulator